MARNQFILVMVKPWALQHAAGILQEFDGIGFRLRTVQVDKIPIECIAAHYQQHAGRFYFEPMIIDHQDKPAVISVYQGDREEFGNLKLKIRARYDPEIVQENPHRREALHTSMTLQEFQNEFGAWKGFIGGTND